MPMSRNEKLPYSPPAVKRSLSLGMDERVLAGSIVQSINEGGVRFDGLEVEEMSFGTESPFNHQWE